MIAFAFVDAHGIPTGGGMNRAVPPGAIPLPKPFTALDLARLQFIDGIWQERALPAPDVPSEAELAARAAAVLERARAEAARQVNAAIGVRRTQLYTDIPGQTALYLEKRAEAAAYVAATENGSEPNDLHDFPLIQNEVGITAETPWQLAQLWLHLADQFRAFGGATERLRLSAQSDITAAQTVEEVEAAQAKFSQALAGLST